MKPVESLDANNKIRMVMFCNDSANVLFMVIAVCLLLKHIGRHNCRKKICDTNKYLATGLLGFFLLFYAVFLADLEPLYT